MECWWKSFHQRSLYPTVNNIYRYERFIVMKQRFWKSIENQVGRLRLKLYLLHSLFLRKSRTKIRPDLFMKSYQNTYT